MCLGDPLGVSPEECLKPPGTLVTPRPPLAVTCRAGELGKEVSPPPAPTTPSGIWRWRSELRRRCLGDLVCFLDATRDDDITGDMLTGEDEDDAVVKWWG